MSTSIARLLLERLRRHHRYHDKHRLALLHNLFVLFEIIRLETIQHRHQKLVGSRIYSGFYQVLGDVMLLVRVPPLLTVKKRFYKTRAASLHIFIHFFNDSCHAHVTSTFIGDIRLDDREKSCGCCFRPKHGLVVPSGCASSPLNVS